MNFLRRIAFLLLAGPALCQGAGAKEVIPPAPAAYCNDYAGALSADAASRIDRRLAQFERETSNQIVVAIYPTMQTDSSVEDYTVRVAQSWHVGQKQQSNGAVLFVFVAEHKLYIQVGYGLEGALPDITAKRIIEDVIVPRLRQRDFDGGISAGVDAMIAATKGEYKGTGSTAGQQQGQAANAVFMGIFILLFIVVFVIRIYAGGGQFYSSGGYYRGGGGGFGGGGGGGGFSGGGGSFGGGGAGGGW